MEVVHDHLGRLIDPVELDDAIAALADVLVVLQRQPPEHLLGIALRRTGLDPQHVVLVLGRL